MSIGQTLMHSEMRAVIRERDEALRDRDGVTVVVPCYCQCEYLSLALDSLLSQTVAPLEVIVVDDGTPGTEAEEIKDITESTFGYTYVRVTNRGLPSARNVGLMLARGRAFLPLDADDWLDPTYIQKTLPFLDDHDVVLTGLQEHGVRTGVYNPGFDMPWQDVSEADLWTMNRYFYAALLRTDLLRSIGGYSATMRFGWEDLDVWIDLKRRGARFTAVEEPLLHYRTSNDGMMAVAAREHREWNIAEMRRHHLG